MKRLLMLLAAMLLLLGYTFQATADVITGPTLTENVSNQTNSGLELTALADSYLQSVVYQNQGGADTIELGTVVFDSKTGTYGVGEVVGTISVPSGNPTFTASSLNWQMTAGTTYALVATGNANNGKYAAFSFPASDTQISVTTGVFSADLIDIATNSNYWGDFNDITTVSIPEPSSFILVLLPALLGVAVRRSLRRKDQAVCVCAADAG